MKTLALLLPALFAFSPVYALTFCVNDIATLDAALTLSTAFTAEPITIKIVQGTYSLNANWDYQFAAPTVLEGGYTAQCASRQVNPSNTVIDGQSHEIFLRQRGATPQAMLNVDSITFKNSTDVILVAGGSTDGSLSVTNVRFTQLQGIANNAAVNFGATGGLLNIENVQIDKSTSFDSNFNCVAYVSVYEGAPVLMNHLSADIRGGRDFCVQTGQFGDSDPSLVYISNSIFWSSDDTISKFSFLNTDSSSISIVNSIHRPIAPTSNVTLQNSINAAPAWLDPANGNYRLANSSPAINSGESVVLGGEPATE